MQVLIILVIFQITPWVIFQKYNCGHNEERQACLLLTLVAQGFELSLGGGLHKKTQCLHRLESYGTYCNTYIFQWFEIFYVLHFKLRTFWHCCKKAPCSNFNVACKTDVLLSTIPEKGGRVRFMF